MNSTSFHAGKTWPGPFFVLSLLKKLVWLSVLALYPAFANAVTYANASTAFSWIDASTHTKLGPTTGGVYSPTYRFSNTGGCGSTPPYIDDSMSSNIPIGFTFMYGGVNFTDVRIMTNGRLQFANNITCGFGSPVTQLPYPNAGLNYTLRIYGGDLDPSLQSEIGGGYITNCTSRALCYVSYATLGVAPYRSFVVTWSNVPEWTSFASATGSYNVQIILQENGEFIYQYGANTPGPGNTVGQVGWQVDSADYEVPAVGYPASGTATKYYIPRPVAEYRMEQVSWNGTANEVFDTSGNARHGVRVGTAQTTAAGKVCKGGNIPSNTNSSIDAIDTGVAIPATVGAVGTISFWFKPNGWTGAGIQDNQLFDATIANNEWFFLTKHRVDNNNVTLRFFVRDSTGSTRSVETANLTSAALSSGWVHIAVSWNFNALAAANSDRLRIFVNGVLTATSAFTTAGTVSPGIGTLYLGDNRSAFTSGSGTARSANGVIDEFRIYNYEGGLALVQRDMNQAGACLNHYAITTSGTPSVCAPVAPVQVTVTAHDAAHGNVIMPNNTTQVTLSVTSTATTSTTPVALASGGDWSLVSGYGTFNNGTANDGLATYIFNGEYQAVFNYQPTTTGNVYAHVTDGQIVESENIIIPVATCITAPHHLEIQHGSGAGVTCTPSTLTIKACTDALSPCTAYTSGVTGTLSASGAGTPVVNWSGGTSFTIGVSGSVTKDVQVTTAGTTVFGASSTPAASNVTTCNFGSPSCTFTSALAGFIFDVPNHVSDTLQTVDVSAVKQSDSSLACVPAFASATKTLSFACSYLNPVSGTLPVAVNGTDIACGTAGNVSLTFDATGVASTTFRYADVGSIGLTATYTGSGGTESGLTMTGSDSFIAAPASFTVVPASPYTAGSAFGAKVTAKNASGNTTPNFSKETTPETVELKAVTTAAASATNSQLAGPTGAGVAVGSLTPGTFTLAKCSPASAGSVCDTALIWTEVGDLVLSAALKSGNYLSSGLSAWGSAAAGPFKPAYFDTAVTPGTNTFTYSGQPFTVTVTAKNALGATTVNYVNNPLSLPPDNYAKDVTLSDANAGTNNSGTLGSFANASIPAASFTTLAAGVASVSTIAYTYTSRTTAPLTLAMRAVDTDSVSSSGHTEGTTEIRSGRVRMANAYGSERLVLPVMAQAEYYTAAGWILNTADTGGSATPLAAAPTVTVTGGITTAANCPPPTACTTSSRFSGGLLDLRMTAPDAAGYADVTLNVPAWLEYPWRSATAEDPVSRATFGIYKGNNKIIYRRERY